MPRYRCLFNNCGKLFSGNSGNINYHLQVCTFISSLPLLTRGDPFIIGFAPTNPGSCPNSIQTTEIMKIDRQLESNCFIKKYIKNYVLLHQNSIGKSCLIQICFFLLFLSFFGNKKLNCKRLYYYIPIYERKPKYLLVDSNSNSNYIAKY